MERRRRVHLEQQGQRLTDATTSTKQCDLLGLNHDGGTPAGPRIGDAAVSARREVGGHALGDQHFEVLKAK